MNLSLPNNIRKNAFYIDGSWHQAGSREELPRLSPGHGVPVSSVVLCTEEDANRGGTSCTSCF